MARRAEPVCLGVLRGHRALDFTMTPRRRQRFVRLRWRGSAAQARLLQGWLEQPFDLAEGQAFELSFYENFHGIETVL